MTLQRIYYTFVQGRNPGDIQEFSDLGTTLVDGWFVSMDLIMNRIADWSAGSTFIIHAFGMQFEPDEILPLWDQANTVFYDNPFSNYLSATHDALVCHGSNRTMPFAFFISSNLMDNVTAPNPEHYKIIFRHGVKSHQLFQFYSSSYAIEGTADVAGDWSIYGELCQVISPNNWV